jgi:hypothetical protein
LVEGSVKQLEIMEQVLRKNSDRRKYTANRVEEQDTKLKKKIKKFAVACEYVGVGEFGMREALAQTCIVADDGRVLYQKFVKVNEPITDYRDKKANDFTTGEPLNKIRQDIAELRVHLGAIVGLHIGKDVSILFNKGASPALDQLRDIALYDPIDKQVRSSTNAKRDGDEAELQALGTRYIGLEKNGLKTIATKAQAVLRIYKSFEKDYDAFFQSPDGKRVLAESKLTPSKDKQTNKKGKKTTVDRRKELEGKVNMRKTLDDQIDLLMKQIKKGDNF